MTRTQFFATLAALPIVGKFFKKPIKYQPFGTPPKDEIVLFLKPNPGKEHIQGGTYQWQIGLDEAPNIEADFIDRKQKTIITRHIDSIRN